MLARQEAFFRWQLGCDGISLDTRPSASLWAALSSVTAIFCFFFFFFAFLDTNSFDASFPFFGRFVAL